MKLFIGLVFLVIGIGMVIATDGTMLSYLIGTVLTMSAVGLLIYAAIEE